MREPQLLDYQRSFACCEVHTPDLWEGDGTCVICEAVHLDDRAKTAEAALSAIRALVQQWREDAEKATIVARRRALQVCADELEDICEDACLPPEDQK